jgi:hypothetical protein
MPFFSPIHATCPVHWVPLDFITRRMLGEQYRSLTFDDKRPINGSRSEPFKYMNDP